MTQQADTTLPVEEASSGSAESIETLYRRYAGWLRAHVKTRFGASVRHQADDLIQETWLRASTLEGEIRHPRALLSRIASRLVYDQARRDRRTAVLATNADLALEPDQAEALLLKQVILSMPQRYRDVFLLSRFGGFSYPEIAERTGLSVKTVEWRMSKALAHCVACLRT